MPKTIAFFILIISLSSCQVKRYMNVIDGSKSDATLTFNYREGSNEISVIQWDDANQKALARCKNWGYDSISFYGISKRECNAYYSDGKCIDYTVYVKCQCLNKITPIDTITQKIRQNIDTLIPQQTYQPQTKQEKSKVEQLRELKELVNEGILTEEEFQKEKEKILNQP